MLWLEHLFEGVLGSPIERLPMRRGNVFDDDRDLVFAHPRAIQRGPGEIGLPESLPAHAPRASGDETDTDWRRLA